MAINLNGYRPTATEIASGPGLLLGLLISHAQTTAQTCTLYDNTAASGTVLLTVHVAPEQSPVHLYWPRHLAINYATGLAWSAPNCEIAVWAVDL